MNEETKGNPDWPVGRIRLGEECAEKVGRRGEKQAKEFEKMAEQIVKTKKRRRSRR